VTAFAEVDDRVPLTSVHGGVVGGDDPQALLPGSAREDVREMFPEPRAKGEPGHATGQCPMVPCPSSRASPAGAPVRAVAGGQVIDRVALHEERVGFLVVVGIAVPGAQQDGPPW
jgi:hypothetical protein